MPNFQATRQVEGISEQDLDTVFYWDTPVEISDRVLNDIESSSDLRSEFDKLCPPWFGTPEEAFNGLRAFTNARKDGEVSLRQLADDPAQAEWVRRWARADFGR